MVYVERVNEYDHNFTDVLSLNVVLSHSQFFNIFDKTRGLKNVLWGIFSKIRSNRATIMSS